VVRGWGPERGSGVDAQIVFGSRAGHEPENGTPPKKTKKKETKKKKKKKKKKPQKKHTQKKTGGGWIVAGVK